MHHWIVIEIEYNMHPNTHTNKFSINRKGSVDQFLFLNNAPLIITSVILCEQKKDCILSFPHTFKNAKTAKTFKGAYVSSHV